MSLPSSKADLVPCDRLLQKVYYLPKPNGKAKTNNESARKTLTNHDILR